MHMKKTDYIFIAMVAFSLLSSANEVCAQASPGGVSGNNTMWLKANSGVTLSMTNTVTTWAEQSGAGILGDFSTQGAAISKPNHQPPGFLQGGINFNPYVVFNSTATHNSVSSGNAVTGNQILDGYNNTLFQVIRLHTMTATGVWLKWQRCCNSAVAYSGGRLGCEVNPAAAGRMRLDFRTPPNNVGNIVIAEKHALTSSLLSQTSSVLRIWGATDNTVTLSAAAFAPGTIAGKLTLGAEPYGDDYPTKIDIAEEILYSRTLTPAERNKVESYLAVKYGITLAQTGVDANDYTASSGAVIWNRTANTPFLNNITGVGRDDASAQDQRQSLSINNRAMVTMYHGNIPGVFPAFNEDNTNNFASDLGFVLFGDNQADTLVNLCSANGRFSRMARTWKVQVTGTPGVVTLALKKANVPPAITSLIVASDPNFTTGVIHVPIQDNGTELYAPYTFSNNQYFTFGSGNMELNGVVGPVVCQGDNGSVTLNPAGGVTPLSYNWNSTPPQTTQNLTGVPPGTYTVTVTQGNGCSFQESYTITGNATPIYLIVTDTQNTLCTASNGIINVNGSGGTPTYQYSIDGGPWAGQKNFKDLAPGTHTIAIKDQNNCENDTTVTLSKFEYDLSVTAETKDAWCDAGGLGGQVSITATGGASPYSYFWENLSSGKGPEMKNLPKGSYKVIVTDKYGCAGDATGIVEENTCCSVWIPNAFSPNNDGNNDKFRAIGNRPIPKYEMSVYNRWGERVFYTTSDTQGWDGTKDGTVLDAGVYQYRIRYTCEMGKQEFVYKGDITLIR
jgi:gliding motility-associated-like protein